MSYKGTLTIRELAPEYSNGGQKVAISLKDVPAQHREEAIKALQDCYVAEPLSGDGKTWTMGVQYEDSLESYVYGYCDGFNVKATSRARRVMHT
jgi:hypothetical protein